MWAEGKPGEGAAFCFLAGKDRGAVLMQQPNRGPHAPRKLA